MEKNDQVKDSRIRRFFCGLKAIAYKNRKILILFFIALLLLCFWVLLPFPNRDLWPPESKDKHYSVYVSYFDNHTFLCFPDYETGYFQEWHMGAKIWFNGKKTWKLGLYALFYGSPAVIKIRMFPFLPWELKSKQKRKVHKFWLTKKGFNRLQYSLHRSRGKKLYRLKGFFHYSHKRKYHILANCNQYILKALQEAGLPVRGDFALETWFSVPWYLNLCQMWQNYYFSKNDSKK